MTRPRRFVLGDNEPLNLFRVTDAHGCTWTRETGGWYPAEGSYHRKAASWWWLITHRSPLNTL